MTDRPAPRRTLRAEREFGLLVGGILAALGTWWLLRGKFPLLRVGFVAAGLVLVVAGLALPRALVVLYRGWMALAEGISKVVTVLVLSVVFFLVAAPIGLFKRLRRWDPLERRAPPAASYWRPYDARQHDSKHFEKMY